MVVIGNDPQTYKVAAFLLRRMRFGLRPNLIITDSLPEDVLPESLPVLPITAIRCGMVRQLAEIFDTAIAVTSCLNEPLQGPITPKHLRRFRNQAARLLSDAL